MLAQRADFLCEQERVDIPKDFGDPHLRLMPAEILQNALNAGVEDIWLLAFDSFTFHAFAKRIIDRFRLVLTGEYALDAGYTIVDKKRSVSSRNSIR